MGVTIRVYSDYVCPFCYLAEFPLREAVRGKDVEVEWMTALGCESLTRTVIADDDAPVRFAKALNRSVSGSMNELVKCAEFCMSGGELTLPEVGDRLNDTLLSALSAGGSHGYGKPREAFRVMVGRAGSNADRCQTGNRQHGHEQTPPD